MQYWIEQCFYKNRERNLYYYGVCLSQFQAQRCNLNVFETFSLYKIQLLNNILPSSIFECEILKWTFCCNRFNNSNISSLTESNWVDTKELIMRNATSPFNLNEWYLIYFHQNTTRWLTPHAIVEEVFVFSAFTHTRYSGLFTKSFGVIFVTNFLALTGWRPVCTR